MPQKKEQLANDIKLTVELATKYPKWASLRRECGNECSSKEGG